MTHDDPHFLDPNTLDKFFVFGNIFGFHDQTNDENTFTYGYCIPKITNEQKSSTTFQVMNSSDGGYATLIVDKETPNTGQIKSYIAEQFDLSGEELVLQFISPAINMFFKFSEVVDPVDNVIQFEQPKLEITHKEGVAIVGALQGQSNYAHLLAKTEFSVSSTVNSSFEINNSILTNAFEAELEDNTACVAYLKKQISDGNIQVEETFLNTPSPATKQEARNGLVENAALVIMNTIQGVSYASNLPNPYSFTASYSNSIPQKYLLEKTIDLPKEFANISIDNIVSYSTSPLPSPDRKKKKIPSNGGSNGHVPVETAKTCKISLGFNAKGKEITNILINWGAKNQTMDWPGFEPVTLSSDNGADELTITTSFAASPDFVAKIAYQKEIKLQLKDIGYCEVQFSAESIKDKFKNISGSASYRPASAKRSKSHSFSFSDSTWSNSWIIQTGASDLNGKIEYQWTGKLSKGLFKKEYSSDTLTTGQSNIIFTYKE